MLNARILILATSLITLLANASFTGPNSEVFPETTYRRCVSEFCAELVVTNNDEVALKNWNTPSKGVYFPASEEIEKGKIISAFIVFKRCAKTETGNCKISQKLKIMQPDGKIYSDFPESEVWFEKPSSEGGAIGLSVDFVRLIVEPHEQLGQYRFEVVVKDYVSGKAMLLSKSINVVQKV